MMQQIGARAGRRTVARAVSALALAAASVHGAALAQDKPTGRFVEGGDGVALYAREWGNPDGPAILFIHGWSQSSASWQDQTDSALADDFRMVAFDWRGHGQSEKPRDPATYQDGGLLAADVAAVIEAFALDRPVLVGWSYGGILIGDYLAEHGDDAIAGVVTTGAIIGTGTEPFGDMLGEGVAHAVPATSLAFETQYEAIAEFLRACTAAPMGDAAFEEALAINMMTPPWVRGAFIGRKADHRPTYGALSKPLLVNHGAEDAVVTTAAADAFAAANPSATVSLYEDSGHIPFQEEAERFNAELAEFVRAAQSGG